MSQNPFQACLFYNNKNNNNNYNSNNSNNNDDDNNNNDNLYLYIYIYIYIYIWSNASYLLKLLTKENWLAFIDIFYITYLFILFHVISIPYIYIYKGPFKFYRIMYFKICIVGQQSII